MEFEPSEVTKALGEGVPVRVDECDKPKDPTTLASANNIGQFGQVTLATSCLPHGIAAA